METKVNLVAAVCNNMGIGYKGDLPWRLPKEMKHFQKVTQTTLDPGKQNAVLMGRKTWDSIPEKHRPLVGRINIVLSKQLKVCPAGASYLAKSLEDAITWLNSACVRDFVESIHVVGGSDIYKAALDSPYCHRVYLTKIMASYSCDTFFPNFNEADFELVSDPDVSSEIQEEKGINYKFLVYQKKVNS